MGEIDGNDGSDTEDTLDTNKRDITYFISESGKMGAHVPMEDYSFLGSLEREAFTVLTPWTICERKNEHDEQVKMVYRVGMKKDIPLLPGGDTYVVLCHFVAGITTKGKELTKEHIDSIDSDVEKLMVNAGEALRKRYPYVAAIRLDPPDYMMKELEDLTRPQNDSNTEK